MKKLFLILLLVGIALVAAAYWLNHAWSGHNSEEGFTLAPTEWGAIVETVSATGLVQPQEVFAVGSELSGRVVEIRPHAEINQDVQEGEPLLQLDSRLAQFKLDQAKAALQLAQTDVRKAEAARDAAQIRVRKLRELIDKEVGNQKDLDEAQVHLRVAETAIREAELKVDQATLAQQQAQYGLDLTVVRATAGENIGSSPSASRRTFTIIDRKVVQGQLIAPPTSAHLFTLASPLKQMRVHAQVSENDIGKVRSGQLATFTVYAYSEDEARFTGHVVEIRQPNNVHGAVFYDTLIDAANQRDPKTGDWRLRPGMTAAVDIVLRKHTNVWKVPAAALSLQLDEQYQSESARAKLAEWQAPGDRDDWKPVWILDAQGKPVPIFIRIGGRNAIGETGIEDGQFVEVFQWDPQLNPPPNPKDRSTYPQLITVAPPVKKRGFIEPNVKVF
ncbi:MAG TPA: efflux RND transporter periplasmic adaptor subunit [Gemmataceae bacterium]|nr:efflux RND transporter periplasmic adaptor subunit [Gemmataceae bacterium]